MFVDVVRDIKLLLRSQEVDDVLRGGVNLDDGSVCGVYLVATEQLKVSDISDQLEHVKVLLDPLLTLVHYHLILLVLIS
jgi:hypothetical protein